jgi:hypothetical protein
MDGTSSMRLALRSERLSNGKTLPLLSHPELVSKTKRARKIFHRELLLANTLFRSFAIFLLAWLPLAILLMVPMNEVPTWVYLMTVFLAHGSTATNSLLYYTTNERFHRGFLMLIKKFCGRNATYFTRESLSTSFNDPSRNRPSESIDSASQKKNPPNTF